jgi:ribosome-associated protein
MATTEVNKMLAAAAAACEDKKAEDIRIFALDPTESGLADYFLICSGNSDRQNLAIADEVDIRLKREYGTLPNSVEGRRQGEWILMDYVDFIVHIFTTEKRQYYGLERLRKSATSLTMDDLAHEIAKSSAPDKKIAMKTKAATKAPAKKSSAIKPNKAQTSSKKSSSRAVAKKAPAKSAVKKSR